MAATETSYRVVSLPEEARNGDGDRVFIPLRRTLELGAFGASGAAQAKAGEDVVPEHDETGPGADGQEELYVVVAGRATFTVDGDEVDAPQGTVILVPPGVSRKARADEAGTIVFAVGGRRGEAYRPPPGAELRGFFERYNEKDYEGALVEVDAALEKFPGNALFLYNVACLQALLGRPDESLETLRESIEKWPRFKENAAGDEDFASIRDDPRFARLLA
jgi:hypothetical protein